MDNLNNRDTNNTPRIVISAVRGHSGKTVIGTGVCAWLRHKGLTVQPFKKGPDYIDPSWLSAAAGRNCRNLDTILMPEDMLLRSFTEACRDSDIAVIEGAMGLYDSLDAAGNGSTASLARKLKCPVILVVDGTRITRSAAALVSGYQHFEPETNIAGVIFNNVSGFRHEQKLRQAVQQHCGLPVIGVLPKDERLNITERHLGLIPYAEIIEQNIIERVSAYIEKYLDTELLLNIAKSAGALPNADVPIPVPVTSSVKIGVIKDKVFTFYYPENLEHLQRAGAELIFIDSVRDLHLPDIDALYIGGGFPELFLPELQANPGLREDIAAAVESNLPVYAECAGLMYLCRSISWHGKKYNMVGAIPADVELCPKPQGHGYSHIEVLEGNPFFPAGITLWGHEFHYSKLYAQGNLNPAYRVLRGHGLNNGTDGIVYKNMLASYTHLHVLGVPGWAPSFCKLALEYKLQHRLSLIQS